MTEETWLPVVGWEDMYEVSNKGRVRSLRRPGTPGGILKPRFPKKRGYPAAVMLSDRANGRRKHAPIHLLVLESHVSPRPEGLVGCHGPGGQLDNCVENLRWDTQAENILDQLRYGTHPSGATLETCGQGHAYTPENTYWKRCCRQCNNRKTGGQ